MESRVFKPACLVLLVAVATIIILLLDDMRRELARTNRLVRSQMSELLVDARHANETMMRVSKQLDSLGDLAGLPTPVERSLTAYVNSVLDFIERQPGGIGVERRSGEGPVQFLPAAGWVHDARRYTRSLVSHASAKAEILEQLCKNKPGAAWYYAPPSGVPVPLIDFLKRDHPESRKL